MGYKVWGCCSVVTCLNLDSQNLCRCVLFSDSSIYECVMYDVVAVRTTLTAQFEMRTGLSRTNDSRCIYDFYSDRFKTGRFFSPRYPQHYPPRATCQFFFLESPASSSSTFRAPPASSSFILHLPVLLPRATCQSFFHVSRATCQFFFHVSRFTCHFFFHTSPASSSSTFRAPSASSSSTLCHMRRSRSRSTSSSWNSPPAGQQSR